jgi:hypothetical protein
MPTIEILKQTFDARRKHYVQSQGDSDRALRAAMRVGTAAALADYGRKLKAQEKAHDRYYTVAEQLRQALVQQRLHGAPRAGRQQQKG